MKEAWVYILRCNDDSYYTGCTTNLEQRLVQHQTGTFEGYTSERLPVVLVWAEHFTELRPAIEAERRIKNWSRAKKEALIRGEYGHLHELSKKRFR